jgi:hypothetical protein
MPRINVFYILETILAVRGDRDGVTAAHSVKHGIFKQPRSAGSSTGRARRLYQTRLRKPSVGIGHRIALTNYAIRINER